MSNLDFKSTSFLQLTLFKIQSKWLCCFWSQYFISDYGKYSLILLGLCIFPRCIFSVVSWGKSIYFYSWFISRVLVSDCWQFWVIARVLNLRGTLGKRLPNFSLLSHYCFAVHLEGHISSGPLSLFPLTVVFFFTVLITGKGLLEIL